MMGPASCTQCPPGPSSGQGREDVNDDLAPRHDRVPESWWDEQAEAFEAWADSVQPADLEPSDTRALQTITRLTDLRKEIEAAILDAVCEARRSGHTWSEIGVMLDVSKQAAQQRYGPKLDGVPVEGGRAVIDTDERPDADRHLADAYQHQPEDPALIESATRLAARTTPEW